MVNVYKGKITNEKKVIEFLSANKDSGYCDDCISYNLNIKPRQQVNQICSILESKKDIERIKSTCQICRKLKILNYLK